MKHLKFILIGLGTFGWSLIAQTGEVVPLSSKVGLTIDAEENRYYQIFPDVGGFESAQVFDEGNNRYAVRIVWLDHNRRRVTQRQLTLRQFIELQNRIGSTAGSPKVDHSRESKNLIAVNTIKLSDIRPGEYILVIPVKGRRMVGTVTSSDGNHLLMETMWGERKISADRIAAVVIVEGDYEETYLWKVSYAGTGLLGMALVEMGNRWGGITGDRKWYNRFLGLSVGLGVGAWLNRMAPFWILPHHQYNIRV